MLKKIINKTILKNLEIRNNLNKFLFKKGVYIYGFQRSGTHFLEYNLLKNNFYVPTRNLTKRNRPGHKHFRLNFPISSKLFDEKYRNYFNFFDMEDYLTNLNRHYSNNFKLIAIKKNIFENFYSFKKYYFHFNPNYKYVESEEFVETFLKEYINFYINFYKKNYSSILLIKYDDLVNKDNSKISKFLNLNFKIYLTDRNLSFPIKNYFAKNNVIIEEILNKYSKDSELIDFLVN